MAVVVTDNRTIRNEADNATGWTGTTTLNGAVDADPIEATNALVAQVGAVIFDSYHTAAATDLSNHVIYAWVFMRLNLGNTADANGGLMIYMGNGTNAGAWKVAGADLAAFRHDTGPVGWQCPALDTTVRPASPLSRVGTAASVNFATIEMVGTTVNSLIAAPGMNATYMVDIIRILDPTANNGCALTVTGGTSGTPGKFSEIAVEDRSTANLKAHGIIRELGAGVFGSQGPIRFGNPTGTDSSWFEDKNTTLVFESRGFRTTLYKIFITDNGTGTTTFKLGDKVGTGSDATGQNGCFIVSPPGVGAEFDSATDTDVTDVLIYGSTFSGITNGIKLRDPQEFINNIVAGSGTVEPNGAYMFNCSISNSTATRALLWNSNSDTSGRLDGCNFNSPGTGHAIELGSNTPASIGLNNITYVGYASTDGTTGNESVYNNSGKLITITISGGNIPTVRNGTGATTTIISGLTTITLTGLSVNTEVRVYEDVAGVNGDAIDGVENSGTSFSFSATASSVINIMINHLNFLPADIWQLTVPASNTTIPISQVIDRQYFNPV